MLWPLGNVTINYPCDIVHLACIRPSNGRGEVKCSLIPSSHRNCSKVKQIRSSRNGETAKSCCGTLPRQMCSCSEARCSSGASAARAAVRPSGCHLGCEFSRKKGRRNPDLPTGDLWPVLCLFKGNMPRSIQIHGLARGAWQGVVLSALPELTSLLRDSSSRLFLPHFVQLEQREET